MSPAFHQVQSTASCTICLGMMDIMDSQTRSKVMSCIRGRDTKPDVNGGVKLGHVAAQNWTTLGLRGTWVMGGGQSAALAMWLAVDWPPWTVRSKSAALDQVLSSAPS